VLFPSPRERQEFLPKRCASCSLPFGARGSFDTALPEEIFPKSAVPLPAAIAISVGFLFGPPSFYVHNSVAWAIALVVLELAVAVVLGLVLRSSIGRYAPVAAVLLMAGVLLAATFFHFTYEYVGGWSIFAFMGLLGGVTSVVSARILGLLGSARSKPPLLFPLGAIALCSIYSFWSIR